MNWTGGRLQRHSKAHANANLKAQKQHFAKARLQQQNGRRVPSPLQLSAFKVPLKQIGKLDQDQHRGIKRRNSPEELASSGLSTKRRRFDRQPNISPGHSSSGSELPTHVHQRYFTTESNAQPVSEKESRKSTEVERNTLNGVKRSLLRHSDWMGLNVARPLRMKFPSTCELESIGRRRKVIAEDKQRRAVAQTGYYLGPLPDPALHSRLHQHHSDDVQKEVVSIRIGSNIHQSQTTTMPHPFKKLASIKRQSESSESMLLDREVPTCHNSIYDRSNSENPLTESMMLAERPRYASLNKSLVSLEQVRDSETFDEVKAKSDSVSKQSSQPHSQTVVKTMKRRAVDRRLASDGVRSSSIIMGHRLLRSTPPRSEGSYLRTTPKKQRRRPRIGENSSQQIPGSLSSDFLPSNRRCDENHGVRNSRASSNQRLSFRELPEATEPGVNHVALGGIENQTQDRLKFTLELQVEAETEAAGVVHAPSREKDHVGASPQNHQIELPLHSSHPNLFGDGTDKAIQPACAAGEERESNSTACSPAFGGDLHRDKSAQGIPRALPEMGQSLQPPTRMNETAGVHKSIARSPDMLAARQYSPIHVQLRQAKPRQENFMRQRLGQSQQPEAPQGDRRSGITARSDESQAWMRFILQDEMNAISNHFYENPPIKGHSVQGRPPRWLKYHSSEDGTLSVDRELLPSQLQNQRSSSPVQTIKTAANTTLRVANSDAESVASGKAGPPETDFWSQLSPMEGQLDDRLLNLSVYTNPARTERSYIAAPSNTQQERERTVENDSPEQSWTDFHDQSPVELTDDQFTLQAASVVGSPTPSSRSATTASHPPTNRNPLCPISNLFTQPRHSNFHPLRRSPSLFKKSNQTPSMMNHTPERGVSRYQWIDPPRSTMKSSLSARRHTSAFPMDYTPLNHAKRKQQQGYPASSRPPSSYRIAPQLGHDRFEIGDQTTHHISHRKTSFHIAASSDEYIPCPHTDTTTNHFKDDNASTHFTTDEKTSNTTTHRSFQHAASNATAFNGAAVVVVQHAEAGETSPGRLQATGSVVEQVNGSSAVM
ncbi:hypothetical protein EPUS_02685 [Endocarpon pusillum Z07020]|uniref:Uncharacterized protein n=1 Tax=Endocarpon pusillum (strain Z07020 / HMAS-L-300199) TaxID=1263415 RepID=U1GH09_ENDPU|nr:uncharacterized protein EPUS_02685 [Endocarpon pusillum Z07020]ERF76972.1 hypothetical protein EPUS_02685 [Endocarpon pusillum Z07020]